MFVLYYLTMEKKQYYLNVNDETFIRMSIEDYIKLKNINHLFNKNLKEQFNDIQQKLKEKHIQNIFNEGSYELL